MPTYEEIMAARRASAGLSYEEVMAKRNEAKDIPAERPAPEQPSFLESLGHGAAQGFTWKFGDEAQGMIQALGDRVMGYGQEPATGGESFAQSYTRERDSARTDDAKAEAANPKTFLGGEVAAALPSAALGGAAKAGQGLGAIIKGGATTGGLVGALLGVGGSEADPFLQGDEAAADVLDSAAGGTIFGAGGAVAGHVGGKLLSRFTSAGRMNAALRALGQEENLPNQAVAQAQRVVGKDKMLPLQTLETPQNRMTIQRMFKQPEIAANSAVGEANVAARSAEADTANTAAQTRLSDAETALLAEDIQSRNVLRDTKNAHREALQQTATGNEAATHETRVTNQSKVEAYNQEVSAQNEAYAADRKAYEAGKAAKDAEHTKAVEAYNAKRAEESAANRVAQNETAALRRARAERAVDARNEYIQNKEDQFYAIREGKQARNQAIREIRQGDPKLDKQLEKAPRYNLRKLIEKRVPKDDPKLRTLNETWNELEMAREPIARPRVEPPVASPPRSTEVTPRPTKAASGPRPTAPTRPARPTPSVRPEREIAPAYSEPARPGYDAARQEHLAAKQNLASVDEATQPIYDLVDSLETSLKKIRAAKPDRMTLSTLLTPQNAIRGALGYASGGKTIAAEAAIRGTKALLDRSAINKIASNPETYKQLMELAATGQRLKPGTAEAQAFGATLSAFIQSLQEDGGVDNKPPTVQ